MKDFPLRGKKRRKEGKKKESGKEDKKKKEVDSKYCFQNIVPSLGFLNQVIFMVILCFFL